MPGSFGNTDKQYKKEINISEYFAKIKNLKYQLHKVMQ